MVHEVRCQLPTLAPLELWQSEAAETVTVNVPPISCYVFEFLRPKNSQTYMDIMSRFYLCYPKIFSNKQGTPAALQKAHQVPLQSPSQ